MERRIAKDFNNKVQSVITDELDRDQLYIVLREYQSSLNLDLFIEDLKDVIDTPEKMQLYDDIRPLIPLRHQIEYDRRAPKKPSDKIRVIRLQRRHGENLGFAVRGGLEHGVGIYVSHVMVDSQAWKQGLRIGDQIVRVNGFTIDQAIHEEVLNLIKSRTQIVLKVRRVGMVPVRDKANEPVTWRYVQSRDSTKLLENVLDDARVIDEEEDETTLFVNLDGVNSFGCSICSGPIHKPGIFVQSIKVGSLAEEAGLEVGDQLVAANGIEFYDISHSQAVVALKSSKQLTIVIRKRVGIDLFHPRTHPVTIEEDEEEDKYYRLTQMTLLKDKHIREKEDRERKVLEEEKQRRLVEQNELEERRRRAEEERTAREIQEEIVRISIEQQERERERMVTEAQKAIQSGIGCADDDDNEDNGRTSPFERISRSRSPNRPVSPWQLSSTDDGIVNNKQNRNQEAMPLKSMLKGSRAGKRPDRAPTFNERDIVINDYKNSAIPSTNIDFDVYSLFTPEEIEDRDLEVLYVKTNEPLNMAIEGGSNSPLCGKIVVSDIFPGGAVFKDGSVRAGDQLMMVDDKNLINVTLEEAQKTLQDAMLQQKNEIQIIIAKRPHKDYEDEITYF